MGSTLDLDHIAAPLRPLAVPVADLNLDPSNARRHPDRNLAAIEASLRVYGQRKPLVVRREGMVVEAGNGTLEAARRLGWTHLAVVLVDDDPITATGYAIADNRTAELATWDEEALGRLLAELQAEDVAVGPLGWDDAEIARLLAVPAGEPASEPASEPELREGDAEHEPDDEDAPLPGDTSEGARLMALLRPAGLRAPFPWFGGKRRVAGLVWAALGAPRLYVEPFAGSLATLLARPPEAFPRGALAHEHVNDLDGYITNFWRACAADPEGVARWCDWPVHEADLRARHLWLVNEGRRRLAALPDDPAACDAQVAGWWCWGISAWIGSGWCAKSVHSQRPHLGGAQGVHHSQLPHLGGSRGVTDALLARFAALRDRLRRVTVCRGDWSRVLTEGALCAGGGSVGVFLDPPYGAGADRAECYAHDDQGGLAGEVRAWALAAVARDPGIRIALAGYAGEHQAHMPASWRCVAWASKGAYQRRASLGATQGYANRSQERLWFSPACLPLPPLPESP